MSAAFVATRVALSLAGLRFNFDVRWMFLSDPVELRERLLETIYYFHAYPPGMNLLTGVLLKISTAHVAALAHLVLAGFGLLLVNALYYLLRAAALRRRAALGVALAFSLIPQSLYFENLYLYTVPTAALVGLAAALFHRGVLGQTFRVWAAFFAVCAAIGWLRSTFHLAWFVAMVALAWAFGRPGRRRALLLGAAAPFAFLLALYLKNYFEFGVFGSTSAAGGNLTHVTVRRLPEELRDRWIREGKLSPFAGVHVYASAREYLRFFDSRESARWPRLDAFDRPSVGAPNYNHWFFLEISRRRSEDARYVIENRPLEYAGTVLEGFLQIFEPSTTWHPADKRRQSSSPHSQHRQVLGRYERFYNRVVHGLPFGPVGLYVFLPVVLVFVLRRLSVLRRRVGASARGRNALLTFCLIQIVYVVGVSSLVTVGESARYRYQVEALIWVLVAFSLRSFVSARRRAVAEDPG